MNEQENPRDTHFAGFAKALWSELLANPRTFHSHYEKSQQTVIARRAYDLAMHVMASQNGLAGRKQHETEEHYRAYLHEMLMEDVPDLAELPSEPE